MDAPSVGACARRIAAASLNAKAKESLPVERVDHAAWRMPSLRARRFHIKPLRVDRVDLRSEVIEHDATLELQRRRHFTLVHREVARQDHEAFDLLEA
jgi:hypothetical protein